jgi:hypothetical protein
MSTRRRLLGQVERALGDRQLVWFGTRGDDIESLAELPQLSHSFSLTNTYERRLAIEGHSLEDLTSVRVDLDAYDIDDHPRDESTDSFRRDLLRVLARPSAILPYRPSSFLSAVCFARRDRCTYLGMFKDHQAAFEHKPWVESGIRDLDIPHIPWVYVADSEQLQTLRLLTDGPVVLRRSRGSGGTGLTRISHAAELARSWPAVDEAFISVAPFVADGVPVNVGGVVWSDGVTVHPASVQLIGQRLLTDRPFGYCGNDFGAMQAVDTSTIDQIEAYTARIGRWLRKQGYRGAFGVDYLVKNDIPLFTEVNARFQGSTHLSSEIAVERDEPCILLEHVAAHLGIEQPERPPLREYVEDGSKRAHIVVHHLGDEAGSVDPLPLVERFHRERAAHRSDVRTRPTVTTLPGGVIVRLTVKERVTTNGFDLLPPWESIIAPTERLVSVPPFPI